MNRLALTKEEIEDILLPIVESFLTEEEESIDKSSKEFIVRLIKLKKKLEKFTTI